MSHRFLTGSVPGQLDPSQPSRLLRDPSASLLFASFDECIAGGSSEHHRGPKRIVVELSSTRTNLWHFVPEARRDPAVEDEGPWPQLVNVCGEMVSMSRDQWDIYKLDPVYDCLVRRAPFPPIITRAAPTPPHPPATPPPVNAPFAFKRKLSDSPSLRRTQDSPTGAIQKKFKTVDLSDDFSSSEDNDEVEAMVIEGLSSKRHLQSERLRKVRANKEEARRLRREFLTRWRKKRADAAGEEDMRDGATQHPLSTNNAASQTMPMKNKRKVPYRDMSTENSDIGSGSETDTPSSAQLKRTRMKSPNAVERAISEKRIARERKRREEIERRMRMRNEAMQRAMLDEVLRDVPPPPEPSPVQASANGQTANAPSQEDEEVQRRAALEASKRKIAELEADRPLWEEQARRRRMQEEDEARAAEAAKQRAREEVEKARANAHSRVSASTAAPGRRAGSAQESAEAREAEAARRRVQAQEDVQAELAQCARGAWTPARALARYTALSARFDTTDFHGGAACVFAGVPWPVLVRPGTFGVEDIDWAAVEAFFARARDVLRMQARTGAVDAEREFRTIVERSHKRFHPDRWRARKVLSGVVDEEERECLEVAANTVAQALTPLWKEVTGR